jgi:hypothetical protein
VEFSFGASRRFLYSSVCPAENAGLPFHFLVLSFGFEQELALGAVVPACPVGREILFGIIYNAKKI